MFYYAVLDNDEYVVSVTQSDTEITADNYISITAEQYADTSLVGQRYDRDYLIFETPWWTARARDIQYDYQNPKSVALKLDEIDAEIATLEDGVHTHANKAVLDGITADMISGWNNGEAAADVLAKIKTVDGANSGLDADTLDGMQASAFATVAQLSALETTVAGKADSADIPTKTSQLTNDSGFKTVDTNTTYSLSKSGSTITLTGSDGSSTSVTDADSNTTYSKATDTVLGLVKVGYTESGKNYPVELNANGQMFVNVPWTDTNTTYTLSSFGVTATAAELNKLDGVTATATELNYVDGVTSNIQTQLNGKAASSHTHAYLSTSGGDVDGNLNVNGIFRVNGQQAFYYSGTSQTIGTNNATGGTNIACGSDATCAVGGALLKTATVIPRSTGTYYCGNANFRWKGIYSAAAVNVSSDERLKENIVKLHADEAVDFINSVDVCSFNYIGDDSEQIGVMAQDILAKAPNLAKALVTQDENGYYGVKTSDLVFPLIVAVQELSKQVKELKGE